MTNIKINRPRVEDIGMINEFFQVVIRDTFEKNGIADLIDMIEEEIQHKKVYLNDDIESKGKYRYFLIAKEGSKVLGSIAYGPSNELIISCTNGDLKEVVEIGTVFVHPDYQKNGIGSKMLSMMFEELGRKGIKEFCLDSGYTIAQKIWVKKFGMPQYYLKDYWGENADHMIWRIKVEDVLK